MLSLALILIAFEAICHALLALLHLLQLPSLRHRVKETLVGLLYAGMTGALLVGVAMAYAHHMPVN